MRSPTNSNKKKNVVSRKLLLSGGTPHKAPRTLSAGRGQLQANYWLKYFQLKWKNRKKEEWENYLNR